MDRSRSQAAKNRPEMRHTDGFGQVLPFRRPGQPLPVPTPQTAEPDVDIAGLARYEQERQEEPEEEVVDYRQRMLMNVIALAVLTFLLSTGVWLADTIADMERDQDCMMQGRVNCAPIELPVPTQP